MNALAIVFGAILLSLAVWETGVTMQQSNVCFHQDKVPRYEREHHWWGSPSEFKGCVKAGKK